MKLLLIITMAVMALMPCSVYAAAGFKCIEKMSESTLRVIVITGNNLFLVCEGPSTDVINQNKTKYCSGAMFSITSETASSLNNQGIIEGTTSVSALNNMPLGINLKFEYQDGNGAVQGQLELSSGALSPNLGLNLPLKSSYECTPI